MNFTKKFQNWLDDLTDEKFIKIIKKYEGLNIKLCLSAFERIKKREKIKFAKNFIKLHGQKTASLLEARIVDLEDMSDNDFQDLAEYDCKAVDGSYYPLKKNNQYCLLVFLGDKNIPFSTLRNIQKYEYYKNKIKTIFEVVVENDKCF